jgi:hypothetical protein
LVRVSASNVIAWSGRCGAWCRRCVVDAGRGSVLVVARTAFGRVAASVLVCESGAAVRVR